MWMDMVVFPQNFDPTFSDPIQLESYPAEAQVSSERQATAIAHQRNPTGCARGASSSRPAGAEKHVVVFTVAPDLYIGIYIDIDIDRSNFGSHHLEPSKWSCFLV